MPDKLKYKQDVKILPDIGLDGPVWLQNFLSEVKIALENILNTSKPKPLIRISPMGVTEIGDSDTPEIRFNYIAKSSSGTFLKSASVFMGAVPPFTPSASVLLCSGRVAIERALVVGNTTDFIVENPVDTPSIQLFTESGKSADLLMGTAASSGGYPLIGAYRNDNTWLSPTAVANNDVLFNIRALPYSGTGYLDTAEIRMAVDGTFGANTRPPSRISFHTNVGDALSLDHLILAGNGGIMVGSPATGTQGAGTINVATGYYTNGKGFAISLPSGGATGSFVSADIPAKTVTVKSGIITSIV